MTVERLLARIEDTISRNGGNTHKYPFTIGKSGDSWNVIIEIDCRQRTFDVETAAPNLVTALDAALVALKRQYAHPGR